MRVAGESGTEWQECSCGTDGLAAPDVESLSAKVSVALASCQTVCTPASPQMIMIWPCPPCIMPNANGLASQTSPHLEHVGPHVSIRAMLQEARWPIWMGSNPFATSGTTNILC